MSVPNTPSPVRNLFSASFLAELHRYAAVMLLGFASGLPLALTGQAMQAWLAVDGLEIATIGFLGLVGMPYIFKFVWAPLMDRFELPLLGRRRGWLVLTQLALAGALLLMAALTPSADTRLFALVAVLVAFLSASQDVVVDAYRTDLLEPKERGLGASLFVFAYRLAMVLSGGIAFIWADSKQGFGWSWPQIYGIMALIMSAAAVVSLLFIPSVPKHLRAPQTVARNDLMGFAAIVVAVVVGYQMTNHVITPAVHAAFAWLAGAEPGALAGKWADLLGLLMGIGITLPLALLAARVTRFDTLNRSMSAYFAQAGAVGFLVLIILYKLGDAFAGALFTTFLIRAMEFSQAEIGVVNKVLGIWLTIGGALVGGFLMIWLGLFRSLLLFGILQLLSNFGYYAIAVSNKGAWGSVTLPAFDWIIVSLNEATNIDYLLLSAVIFENITSGMGTAAFVALLMALCNQRFTATHYALLSALAAVGRVWVGPMSGVLVESIGWPGFFVFSIVMAFPGLLVLYWLRNQIRGLDAPKTTAVVED